MTDTTTARRRSWLAVAVIAAQLLFVGGMLLLGVIEGHGYSAGRHDISDLGALTAQHATATRLIVGIAGATTIAFALLALRPSLRSADGRESIGAWLVALSLPALDTMSDAFFRLDCRAADAGCTMTAATTSWHGKAHIAFFVIAALATVAAPFVLAHRMRRVDGWQDLAVTTRVFGVLTIVALAVTAATSGTAAQGWTQRGAIVLVTSGVGVLGWRVMRLCRPATTPVPVASRAGSY